MDSTVSKQSLWLFALVLFTCVAPHKFEFDTTASFAYALASAEAQPYKRIQY